MRCVGCQLQSWLGHLHRWCGQRVWLVDGSSCSMPDTPELQTTFGQPDGQKPGCGYPVAKIVVMLCWASGAILEAAIGPYRQSKLSLWRSFLLDPTAYPAEKIAALYRDRWMIELRFRDIKITLGMDVLRGKSADVVYKEIHMHLLAYNLIRSLMWQAAQTHGRNLHRISFAGTVDQLNAVTPYLWLYQGTRHARRLEELLLHWIAHTLNPHRPNRIEPRAVKRRPKQYALLNQPRRQMRKALIS